MYSVRKEVHINGNEKIGDYQKMRCGSTEDTPTVRCVIITVVVILIRTSSSLSYAHCRIEALKGNNFGPCFFTFQLSSPLLSVVAFGPKSIVHKQTNK